MQPKGCTAADRYLNLTEVYFSIESIGNDFKKRKKRKKKKKNSLFMVDFIRAQTSINGCFSCFLIIKGLPISIFRFFCWSLKLDS